MNKVKQQNDDSILVKEKLKIKLVAIEDQKIYDGKNVSSIAPMAFGDVPNDYVLVVTQKYKTRNVGRTELLPYVLIFNQHGIPVECEVNRHSAKGVIRPSKMSVNAQTDVKEHDGTKVSMLEPLASKIAEGDALTLFQEFETSLIGRGKKLLPSFQLNDGNSGKNYDVTLFHATDGEIFPSTGGGEALAAIADYLGTDDFTLDQLGGLTDFIGEVCAVDSKKIYLKLEARKREVQIIELQKSYLGSLEIELGERVKVAMRNKKIEAHSMKQSLTSVSRRHVR